VKLDDDDKTIVAFDKKLIELLKKKLVVVNKEIGILKTLKLELVAFQTGDKIKQNKYHYLAGEN